MKCWQGSLAIAVATSAFGGNGLFIATVEQAANGKQSSDQDIAHSAIMPTACPTPNGPFAQWHDFLPDLQPWDVPMLAWFSLR